MKGYIAIDIGASSGRHIFYYQKDGKWEGFELHRFKNEIIKKDNHLFWNTKQLEKELIVGLKNAKEKDLEVLSIGIDTFGVDYALLDSDDSLVREVYCYQDRANIESKEEVLSDFKEEELFTLSGTYPQYFNTLFQLKRDQKEGYLKKTKTILFFASYLYFLLTGKKYNELSFASTSGLLEKGTGDYSSVLLSYLGLEKNQFAPFLKPGEEIGLLKDEITEKIGYQCKVVMTYTHDTAASCFGADIKKGELFLSSGTWSLLGAMEKEYHIEQQSFDNGFTNELNDQDQIRFLKNIVGMKLINQVKEEVCPDKDITEIVKEAEQGKDYPYTFDASDSKFLSPVSMKEEILSDFKTNNVSLPGNDAQLFYAIYHSLALQYKKAVAEIEKITGKSYSTLCIFGGGNKNLLLDKMTEELTRKKVRLGPSEATSFGNFLGQIK